MSTATVVIAWESLATGSHGHGSPMDRATAARVAEQLNREWAGTLAHFLVPSTAARTRCESNLLRDVPSEPLAATPAEAFSGERSEP